MPVLFALFYYVSEAAFSAAMYAAVILIIVASHRSRDIS
jgi:hypothetical protein